MARPARLLPCLVLLAACDGPAAAPDFAAPAARGGVAVGASASAPAIARDEYLLRLPPSHSQDGMTALRELALRHGAVVRHEYSARVGLDDTLHVRIDAERLSAMRGEWPGLSVRPAVMRYLSTTACGDGMCGTDEAANAARTATCSVDCGVPSPREDQDELGNSLQDDTVGASASWARTQGDTVRVCVIDTGYDTGMTSKHADRPLHLDGGYSLPDDSPDFHATSEHGTHVTGIIAAPKNSIGMVGIAPAAEIRVYNVFEVADGLLGASDGDIIAAVDRAIGDGCQIVNMSFGGGFESELEHVALASAYAQGLLLVAAAGNSEDATQGLIRTASNYPAAYPEVLAVGALTPDQQIASFSSTGPVLELSAPGVSIYSSVPVGSGDRRGGISCGLPGRGTVSFASFAPIGGSSTPLHDTPLASCGFGSVAEVAKCSSPLVGRLALIERGPSGVGQQGLPFADKVKNAREQGALGVILYNHRDGDPAQAGALLTDIDIGGGVPVPVLTLAAGDGEFLAERLQNSHDEITCSLAATPSDWAVLDGTSMAAPVVSGVAALVLSAYPTLSNVALRRLLLESAVDLGAPGRDDAYGFGRVDAGRALMQGSPHVRCGDGQIDPASEVCDGAAVHSANCEDLGFDGVAGGAVVCNAGCSGLDVSGCKCLPRGGPFEVSVDLLRNYPKGPVTGTLVFYHVSLGGQPVRGAYAEVTLKSSGQIMRQNSMGPSDAGGTIAQFLPTIGNGLPAGDYEVDPVISKAAGRCHDDQPLSPFHVTIKS